MLKLAPSILAADFSYLADEVLAIEKAGAHYVHIDVMDGVFVPNISIGTPVISSIRKITDMTFDVHLMISEPYRYLEMFADVGADILNFHIEAVDDAKNIINKIRSLNKRAAVTIKPNTAVESVFDILGEVDMVLVMSVEPGFGGQSFMHESLKKAESLADYISKNKLLTDIQMDGGINLSNVNDVLSAGVNVVVVGSSVFGSENAEQAVKSFYNVFKEFGAK